MPSFFSFPKERARVFLKQTDSRTETSVLKSGSFGHRELYYQFASLAPSAALQLLHTHVQGRTCPIDR